MVCSAQPVALAAAWRSKRVASAMPEASFATLGPTLLARKGGAKPAMRPQLAPIPGVTSIESEKLEDLGWNDMGDAREAANEGQAPSPVQTKKSAPKKARSAQKKSDKPARRAAFTLRLDADRHLKLRLAATMQGMSAQALVTEAIDAVFEEIEDLEALARRMKRN